MIGEKIRLARRNIKMSQKELGRRLGKSESTICEWEKGNRSPDVELLPAIAQELQTSIAYLLVWDDKPPKEVVEHFGGDVEKATEFVKESDAELAKATPRVLTTENANEYKLLEAYRGADLIYQSVALELLENHQKRT